MLKGGIFWLHEEVVSFSNAQISFRLSFDAFGLATVFTQEQKGVKAREETCVPGLTVTHDSPASRKRVATANDRVALGRYNFDIMGDIGTDRKAKWALFVYRIYFASRFFQSTWPWPHSFRHLILSWATMSLRAHIACIGPGTFVHMAGRHLSIACNRHICRHGKADRLLALTTRMHALGGSIYCR